MFCFVQDLVLLVLTLQDISNIIIMFYGFMCGGTGGVHHAVQGPASTRYPILFSSISLDTRLVSISSTYIRISSS